MNNDDDIWDEEGDHREYEKNMHEREMNKLEDEIYQMGFREGMIHQSDEIIKKNYLNGVADGFEQYQIVGYAKGKAFLVRSLLNKFGQNVQNLQEIKQGLSVLENEKQILQKNEKEIDEIASNLLKMVFNK